MLKIIGSLAMGIMILSSGIAYADHDVKIGGTVKSINSQSNSFVINEDVSGQDVVIRVNPATDFEAKASKNNLLSWDRDVQFEYLQIGDWVEIEVSNPNASSVLADEVKIYRK